MLCHMYEPIVQKYAFSMIINVYHHPLCSVGLGLFSSLSLKDTYMRALFICCMHYAYVKVTTKLLMPGVIERIH